MIKILNSMKSVMCLCILLFHTKLTTRNNTSYAIPLDYELPRLEDTDMIELYHLRSFPLLAIQSPAGSFHIQTSGLALRSTNTPELIVLEFKPVNFSAAYLPLIIDEYDDVNANNKTLIWDKRAMISYMSEIDKTYWQQSTFLARVNGVVYENYVKWIHEYLDKDRYFVPQSICSSSDKESCFTVSETWDSFVGDSLRAFAQNAVQMHAIISPRASDMQILSFTEPAVFSIIDNVEEEESSRTRSKKEEEGSIRMTENDIARYYSELMDCMQAYQLEEFTSALRSCMSEQVGYIHLEGKQYYEIRPRHPFVLNREYLQPIPDAQFAAASNTDIFDYTIAGAIVVLTMVGFIAALYKMKMFEFVLHKTTKIRRRRLSMQAPVEGGYSEASELPVYREWGSSNSNSATFSPISYSSLPTEASNDSEEAGTDVQNTDNGEAYCSIANLHHNVLMEESVEGVAGYKNDKNKQQRGSVSSRIHSSSSDGHDDDNTIEMTTSPSKMFPRKNPSPLTHKPINMYSE